MPMSRNVTRWLPVTLAAAAASVFLLVPRDTAQAAGELNPKAISYKLPDQIKWRETASGSQEAVLLGDPSKPGLYIVLVKWLPHRMSHPHFHNSLGYAKTQRLSRLEGLIFPIPERRKSTFPLQVATNIVSVLDTKPRTLL